MTEQRSNQTKPELPSASPEANMGIGQSPLGSFEVVGLTKKNLIFTGLPGIKIPIWAVGLTQKIIVPLIFRQLHGAGNCG